MRQRKNRWWVGAWYRPRRDIPADQEQARELASRDLVDSSGYRWRLVPRHDPAELERGVELVDRQGDPRGDVVYRLTLDRSTSRPCITSLTVEVPTGSKIDKRFLDRMPLQLITDAAQTYLNEADQLGRDEMIIVPEEGDESIHVHGTAPSPEEFARAYNSTPTGSDQPRRKALSRQYGVSEALIDRWTRAARDAGLIDPPTTGRPPKTRKIKTAAKGGPSST